MIYSQGTRVRVQTPLDAAYAACYNAAVDLAGRIGSDVGIEKVAAHDGHYRHFGLPRNRTGHELRCEVVKPGYPAMIVCGPQLPPEWYTETARSYEEVVFDATWISQRTGREVTIAYYPYEQGKALYGWLIVSQHIGERASQSPKQHKTIQSPLGSPLPAEPLMDAFNRAVDLAQLLRVTVRVVHNPITKGGYDLVVEAQDYVPRTRTGEGMIVRADTPKMTPRFAANR